MPAAEAPFASVLEVEAAGPEQVRVGQPHQYTVEVTNVSDVPLQDVQLMLDQDQNLQVEDSSPPWEMNGEGEQTWMLGMLDPGEARGVRIQASATQSGQSQLCLTADYKPFVCVATNVIQPELEVTLRGPQEVLRCEEVEYVVTVTNSGVGPARDVTLTSDLPAGLKSVEGRRTVDLEVGGLEADASKEFRIIATPTRNGEITYAVRAESGRGLTSESSTTTIVREPILTLTAEGAPESYIGVPIEYRFTLRNDGDGEARETVLTAATPAGTEFESASDGGRLDGERAVWELGTLQPGDARTVSYEVEGSAAGVVRVSATADALCAVDATATAMTELTGVPALLLEVVDNNDPIRVDREELYEVTVTNQGSQAAKQVAIECTLPDALDYVSAEGPTDATSRGAVITFAPLAQLAPGETAEWQVRVRGVDTGDIRFRTMMNASELTQPVRESEATRVYR